MMTPLMNESPLHGIDNPEAYPDDISELKP